MAATGISSTTTAGGFSARLMLGKGANSIPGTLGPKSPKKLHSMGKTLEAEREDSTPAHVKPGSNEASPPPSKTANCKDTHSLWKSVQDCHASLAVENPRHFEFAVANLCFLLKAYGRELDNYVKFDIDKIFQTIRCLALDPSKRPTTRMQLLKVIELRARRWNADQKNGPESDKAQSTVALNGDSKQPKSSTRSIIATKEMVQQPQSEKDTAKAPNRICMRHPRGLPRTDMRELPQGPGTGGNKLCFGTPIAGKVDPESTDKPPNGPKSTGFWDALTTLPEIRSHLPPIPEEVSSEGLVELSNVSLEGVRAPNPTTQSHSLSTMERSNRSSAVVAAVDDLPVFRESPTPPLRRSSSPTLQSPVDPSLGSGFRTRRFSTGSAGSCIQPQQYSREFLLKCWDSPFCKEMPAALQHTIPHSDIYYIIRIPTFEDPSFLLSDTTPPNIVSTLRYPDRNQTFRKRHVSWPNVATKSLEEPYGKSSFV